jgi:hypothetical protein
MYAFCNLHKLLQSSLIFEAVQWLKLYLTDTTVRYKMLNEDGGFLGCDVM